MGQLMEILEHKKCKQNVELVSGDTCDTVPKYVEQNPQLKTPLLNLNTDISTSPQSQSLNICTSTP